MTEKTTVFTSAADFGSTGDFYWDSQGVSIGPHYNWAANEPNNSDTEQCLGMLKMGSLYMWRDDDCLKGRQYICESMQ